MSTNHLRIISEISNEKGQDAAREYFMSLSKKERRIVLEQMHLAIDSMTESMVQVAESIKNTFNTLITEIGPLGPLTREIAKYMPKDENGHNTD